MMREADQKAVWSARTLLPRLFAVLMLAACVTLADEPQWKTNAPAVYSIPTISQTNNAPAPTPAFDHYFPESLNQAIWMNFLAHTNGRTMEVWSVREHPEGWPAKPPVVAWNTNSLIWGMKGLTALSPCWPGEGASGQVPITALTRRHGYTRGHGMGTNGFRTILKGAKVWFLATNQKLVEVKIAREFVRGFASGDYTIVLFDRDLPASIQPLRVAAWTNVDLRYPARPGAPRPIFKSEASGHVSAEVPGFSFPTWKGGDSGSPDMLPLLNELVFLGGRSTGWPSPQMQADMDELCRLEKINPQNYQLQWADLSAFPPYPKTP
jgi:hypothetical protein